MEKLHLYIYKSYKGFKNLRNFNAEDSVQRKIREMRDALQTLDYDSTEKYLFYTVSYIEEGAMFTILRTIPDEALNHLATTIFVPRGLQITQAEMAEVVKRTSRVISNQTVTSEDLAELGELFSKEYAVDENAPAILASEGREYAYSEYGGNSGRKLNDYFASGLYKEEYQPYAGVILLDLDFGVECTGTNVDSPVESVKPVPAAAAPVMERPAVAKPIAKPIAEPRLNVYRFDLPMKSSEFGAPIRFEIRSKHEIDESPVEGYTLLDDIQEGAGKVNYLDYERQPAGIPQRLAIILISSALVLGFLVGYLVWGGSDSKTDNAEEVATEIVTEVVDSTDVVPEVQAQPVAEVKKEEPKAEVKAEPEEKVEPKAKIKVNEPKNVAADPSATLADAVKYLDENSTWKRYEMEKFADLQGLFDDMNHFRYDRLANHWGPILKDSKYFQKIVGHVNKGRGKDRPAEGDTFVNSTSIARYGFCCAIDK